MKIDKEKFNKLKQLDRIEFRQKLDYINNMGNRSFNYLYSLFVIATIFFSTYIISSLIMEESIIILFKITSSVIFLAFFMSFVEFMLTLSYLIRRNKLRRELEEEYFEIGVKK